MALLNDLSRRFAETHGVSESSAKSLAIKNQGVTKAATYLFDLLTGEQDAGPFLDELRDVVTSRPENRSGDYELAFRNGALWTLNNDEDDTHFERAFSKSPIAVAAVAYGALSIDDRKAVRDLFCESCGKSNEHAEPGPCLNANCARHDGV